MDNIAALIVKSFKGTLSVEEEVALRQWISLSPDNKAFVDQYDEEVMTQKLELMASIDWKKGYERFRERYPLPVVADPVPVMQGGEDDDHLIYLRSNRKKWWRWAGAAAAVVLLAGTVWFTLLRNAGDQQQSTAGTDQRYTNDVAPGGEKAVLTIEGKNSIVLDTARNTTLAANGSNATNENGQLSYRQQADQSVAFTYNKLTTPRGGTYRLTLPDGSKVWLNAASGIRFPSVFVGKSRLVEVTGEAYFEVVKDPARPFLVQTDGALVQVLGTKFNVNAYTNEDGVKTTLAEGSVLMKVAPGQLSGNTSRPAAEARLAPGQQGVMSGGAVKVQPANVDEILAWKDGYFRFNGTMNSIVRQLERWYDVKIVFEGTVPNEFVATIPRSEKLSKVLELLSMTQQVRFTIDSESRTVHVIPE